MYQLLSLQLKVQTQSGYLESNQLEQFITQQWPTMQAPVVIKAHDLGIATMAALRAGAIKGICTFRDPRDCVASDLAFMGYPFELCVKRIAGTLDPIRMYLNTPHMLLVKYEAMMADRLTEIRRIANHLGLRIEESAVQHIDAKTNIQTSKKLCESLKTRPSADVLHLADHVIDPTTHLHHNHINGGTTGRWKTELSKDQIAYMCEFFEPWLLKFSYETEASLDALINGAAPATKPGGMMSIAGSQTSGTFSSGAKSMQFAVSC